MDKVIEVVRQISGSKYRKDDDFADRLSSRYTVIILTVFAILVGLEQYVGNPIACWAPVHFTGSHEKYTNSYCWVRNTYYLPYEEYIPREGEHHEHLLYYQWISLILVGQAALFYIPSTLWHGLNSKAGVDTDNLLNAAFKFDKSESLENHENILNHICSQFHRLLGNIKPKTYMGFHGRLRQCLGVLNFSICGKRFGSYLVCLYLLTKLMYIANVIGQLFMLNWLLSTDYTTYGLQLLGWLVMGDASKWEHSPDVAFPRVTMCDFKVRRLGNVHRYTVQCTLPINLYNEKIYMFLWFWMVFVAGVTCLSFVVWLLRAVSYRDRRTYIHNHVLAGGVYQGDKKEERLEKFVGEYLRLDGVFIMRLIGHNTNNITVTEIIAKLWTFWNGLQDIKDKKKSPPKMNGSHHDRRPSAPPLSLHETDSQPLMDH